MFITSGKRKPFQFQVSDHHAEEIKKHCWSLGSNKRYPCAHYCSAPKKYHQIALHHFVWFLEYGTVPKVSRSCFIDHINRDTLDCRVENLRLVDNSSSGFNRSMNTGSSQYRGVFWDDSLGRWRASIRLKNKQNLYLGWFSKELTAAKVVARLWKELHGDYYPDCPEELK